MINMLLILLFAFDARINVIFMSIKIIVEAIILQFFDESLSSKSLAIVLWANLFSVTLTLLGFMCTISYIGQMLERIDRQVKTIETLFGEMHEGVVVVNEPAINESENNDNDKTDTSVLFYNDTASQLLKTQPKTAD